LIAACCWRIRLRRIFRKIREKYSRKSPRKHSEKASENVQKTVQVRAWVPILRDAIAQVLRLYESDQKERIFFREISDEDFDVIRGRVKRLFSHKVWDDPNPEVNAKLKINEPGSTRTFLKDNGLDVSWVLGGEP